MLVREPAPEISGFWHDGVVVVERLCCESKLKWEVLRRSKGNRIRTQIFIMFIQKQLGCCCLIFTLDWVQYEVQRGIISPTWSFLCLEKWETICDSFSTSGSTSLAFKKLLRRFF